MIAPNPENNSPRKTKKKKFKQNVSTFIFLLMKMDDNYLLLVQKRRFSSKKNFNNHEDEKGHWEVPGGRLKKSEMKDHFIGISREFKEETKRELTNFDVNKNDIQLFTIEKYLTDDDKIKHEVYNYFVLIDYSEEYTKFRYRTNEAESVGFININNLKDLSNNFYDPCFYDNFKI